MQVQVKCSRIQSGCAHSARMRAHSVRMRGDSGRMRGDSSRMRAVLTSPEDNSLWLVAFSPLKRRIAKRTRYGTSHVHDFFSLRLDQVINLRLITFDQFL